MHVEVGVVYADDAPDERDACVEIGRSTGPFILQIYIETMHATKAIC